jgi:hypothetical protein
MLMQDGQIELLGPPLGVRLRALLRARATGSVKGTF